MLPMINIVFLLLVFFMVAGQIAASKPADVELPESVSDTAADAAGIEISIDAAGVVWLGNNRMAGDPGPQLRRLMSTEITGSGTADSLAVTLRVDRGLNAAVLDPVLTALRQQRVSSLRIQTAAAP